MRQRSRFSLTLQWKNACTTVVLRGDGSLWQPGFPPGRSATSSSRDPYIFEGLPFEIFQDIVLNFVMHPAFFTLVKSTLKPAWQNPCPSGSGSSRSNKTKKKKHTQAKCEKLKYLFQWEVIVLQWQKIDQKCSNKKANWNFFSHLCFRRSALFF